MYVRLRTCITQHSLLVCIQLLIIVMLIRTINIHLYQQMFESKGSPVLFNSKAFQKIFMGELIL